MTQVSRGSSDIFTSIALRSAAAAAQPLSTYGHGRVRSGTASPSVRSAARRGPGLLHAAPEPEHDPDKAAFTKDAPNGESTQWPARRGPSQPVAARRRFNETDAAATVAAVSG